MTRRCSHCSHNGHNSRTCPSRGVKLFGVRITDGAFRKSVSMGNLMHYSNGGGSRADGIEGGGSPAEAAAEEEKEAGYASEDFVKGSKSSCRDRKKGIAWTEEEHKMFLLGLRKLGKGDWRGIARTYVISRTPTQVASHAQKYFIRQSNANGRKKRSSLFDIKPDEYVDAFSLPMGSQEPEAEKSNPLPPPPPMDAECESVVSNSNEKEVTLPPLRPETTQYPYPMMYPAYYPGYFPVPLPFEVYRADTGENKSHEVFKPTASHSKVSTDQVACMSTLSLRESMGGTSSPSTTLNLLGGSERHSAFHANTRPPTGSRMNSGSSPIHAI